MTCQKITQQTQDFSLAMLQQVSGAVVEEKYFHQHYFFSDLLPVNVTLMAYAAAVVIGGSVLGLAIYFLATNVSKVMFSRLITSNLI